jgi:hypothetical protein
MLTVDDGKKFAGGLTKVGIDLADAKPASALKGFIDVVLLLRKPAEKGIDATAALGLLIRRAAAEAALTVFRDFRRLAIDLGLADAAELAAELRAVPLSLPELTAKAFAAPRHWEALPQLEKLFGRWLAACRVPEDRRGEMARAFAAELPTALRGEWLHAANARDYTALVAALEPHTPFDKAAGEEEQWRDYRAKLAADIRQPLRSIAPGEIPCFALEQLYVPLRAVWRDAKKEHEPEGQGHLTWLHGALSDWIDAADPADWIRVITGGPGSGKSSSCRMLAADLARQGRKVLPVPLGRLEYHAEAVGALRQWTIDTLGHDPLSKAALRRGEPLVLILDGLDELVKVGRVGEEVVKNFVTELSLRIANLNEDGLRVLLLLVGRPLAAEQAHRLAKKPQAWLEAQPFVIRAYDLDDPEEIGEIDQRGDWWRKFGKSDLPENLQGDDARLRDITTQPLLNWLLAQVLTLKAGEDIGSAHDLYEKLLAEVLQRTHRDARNEAVEGLGEGQLARLLEEVAVAAWHDGDRSVKLSTIRDRLADPQLKQALESLCRKDETAAIETVLDSFFCAPGKGGGDQRVFEFTHKSFREFLTARRMLREVQRITSFISSDNGYGIEQPLRDWFALCGPTAMTEDLLTALRDAAAALDFATVDAYGGAMRRLLLHTSHHGFPLPQKGDWNTKELDRQARDAEEALLAVHSSCAKAYVAKHPEHLPPPLALEWGEDGRDIAGQWLHRLAGRNEHIARLCLIRCCLINISCFYTNLVIADLSGADLSGADLRYANFIHANLSSANLSSADLSGAYLEGANLSRANLSGAELSGAELEGANLTGIQGLTKKELADLKRRAKPVQQVRERKARKVKDDGGADGGNG